METSEQTKATYKSARWPGKTIMVVEDNPTSLLYFKAALYPTQARIHFYDNGKDAIQFLKTNAAVDVILMDIHLPEMNGYEATADIKARWPHIQIIMQSAYVLNGEEVLSYEAGCDDFLVKPVRYGKLISTLKRFLEPPVFAAR